MVKQNAIEYLKSFEELNSPECMLYYNEELLESEHIGVNMIDGRPIYYIYAGSCQTPISDGHYNWYFVNVDALTGKPLFAENGMAF